MRGLEGMRQIGHLSAEETIGTYQKFEYIWKESASNKSAEDELALKNLIESLFGDRQFGEQTPVENL